MSVNRKKKNEEEIRDQWRREEEKARWSPPTIVICIIFVIIKSEEAIEQKSEWKKGPLLSPSLSLAWDLFYRCTLSMKIARPHVSDCVKAVDVHQCQCSVHCATGCCQYSFRPIDISSSSSSLRRNRQAVRSAFRLGPPRCPSAERIVCFHRSRLARPTDD